VFVTSDTLNIEDSGAALSFTIANNEKAKVLHQLRIEPGYNALRQLQARDTSCVRNAGRAMDNISIEAMKRRRNAKKEKKTWMILNMDLASFISTAR
jgi:hypothetical protein